MTLNVTDRLLSNIHHWWDHLSNGAKDAYVAGVGTGAPVAAYTAGADAWMIKVTAIGGLVLIVIRIAIGLIEFRKTWKHRNDRPSQPPRH